MTDPTPNPDASGEDAPLDATTLAELRALLRTPDVDVDELRRAAALRAALDAAEVAPEGGDEVHVERDPLPGPAPALARGARDRRELPAWRGLAIAAAVVLVFGGLVAGFATGGLGGGSDEDASSGGAADATVAQELSQDAAGTDDADGSAESADSEAPLSTTTVPAATDPALSSRGAVRADGFDTTTLVDLGEYPDLASLRATSGGAGGSATPGSATAGAPTSPSGACVARVAELGAQVLGVATVDGVGVLVVRTADASGPQVRALVAPDCTAELP